MLTKEFTLQIDHLDVMFVIEDLQIARIGTDICVPIKNKIDLVFVTYEKTLFYILERI